jgi:hypothetical protein
MKQSRAATRAPPKHKQGVAAHICPKTPPRIIPTLPPNVRVVNTPINLREPGSVLCLAEHMYRDYSKNALAVREQREDDFYHYVKGEGLEARFWCDFHRDFYRTKLASLNRGFRSKSEDTRLLEPPSCHNAPLFMWVSVGRVQEEQVENAR